MGEWLGQKQAVASYSDFCMFLTWPAEGYHYTSIAGLPHKAVAIISYAYLASSGNSAGSLFSTSNVAVLETQQQHVSIGQFS